MQQTADKSSETKITFYGTETIESLYSKYVIFNYRKDCIMLIFAVLDILLVYISFFYAAFMFERQK